MNRIHSALVSFVTIIAATVVSFGQTPEPAAIFYEISGKKLAKPSYILGTFHAICETDMVPVEKLTGFIEKTDQMILELDMDDPAVTQTMMGGMAMAGGKTLRDFYTDAEYARIDTMLKNAVGIPADAVKTIKPTMLAVMVATSPKSLGCKPSAVDTIVMQAAIARKKPVYGIETVESQIAVLNSQPLEKQAKDLLKMADDPAKAIAEIKMMVAVYKEQDAEKIFNVAASQMTGEQEFHAELLDKRNLAWIPKLEASMTEKPAFIAVGAAHLGGKNGVVNLLKKKGYKLRPIRL